MKTTFLSLLLVIANLPQQKTMPRTHWSLAALYIRNTLGAIDYDIEELIEEFPQLSEYRRHARVTDNSLFYQKGGRGGCHVTVRFRYPVGPNEWLPAGARVFDLKNGKRLASWSGVKADEDAGGQKFERVVGRLVRSRQAQLLDLLGADTRGSTRDLDAAPFDGAPAEGKLYRAQLVFNREGWDWRTAVPLRAPAHHAAAIEWDNLTDFTSFYFGRPKDDRPEVVFEVVEREVESVAPRRWRTTYHCRVLGVENPTPPRAEYLTLVAQCREVRPDGKRNPSFVFTFDVRRVVSGTFDAREFSLALLAETAGVPLLRALRPGDFERGENDCASSPEVEMTFELRPGERAEGRPGLLQEFRVIE